MRRPVAISPLFFIALSLALLAEEAPRGTLCIGESSAPLETCHPVSGTKFTVDPFAEERVFLWTGADGGTFVIGSVPKDATEIDLETASREVKLSVRGDASRGWPDDMTVSLGRDELRWKWVIPAKAVEKLASIRMPAGSYSLALAAGRHRTLHRRGVNLSRPAAVDLGRLELVALPVMSGVVIDAEEQPIQNVHIVVKGARSAPDKICATADERGSFRCELEERPAEAISIEPTGLGRRLLELPERLQDHDFGRIVFSKGSELVLTFDRPALLERDLEVVLLQDLPRKYEHVEFAKTKLRAGEERLVFGNVGGGNYFAIVKGGGSLECLAVPIKVEESAVEKVIEIRPFMLHGEVRLGEDRTAAKGTIRVLQQTCEAAFDAPDGTFGGVMWQHGRVYATVQVGSETSELVQSPTLGAEPSSWPIILKDRYISGRVFDAQTKAPIPGVTNISVRGVFGEHGRYYGSAPVNPDGTYRLRTQKPGEYQLAVKADEYSPVEVKISVGEFDLSKELDFPLERGSVVTLEIVSASGQRLPNTTVVEGFGDYTNNPRQFHQADASGQLRLSVRKGEIRTLYVVPSGGSFAIVRLRGEDRESSERVVVPPPVATLRLRSVDRDGKAVRLWPLLRFNGEWVPSSISTRINPSWFTSSQRGEIVLHGLPAGVYEVWGFARPDDQSAFITAGGGGSGPVRIGLSGGEETVQLVVHEWE